MPGALSSRKMRDVAVVVIIVVLLGAILYRSFLAGRKKDMLAYGVILVQMVGDYVVERACSSGRPEVPDSIPHSAYVLRPPSTRYLEASSSQPEREGLAGAQVVFADPFNRSANLQYNASAETRRARFSYSGALISYRKLTSNVALISSYGPDGDDDIAKVPAEKLRQWAEMGVIESQIDSIQYKSARGLEGDGDIILAVDIRSADCDGMRKRRAASRLVQ